MPTELPKQYDPKEAQEKWLKLWNERGYFHSDPPGAHPLQRVGVARPQSVGVARAQSVGVPGPYTIVIPPPNVTGALHMGHALNNTLQDVLIRWRRMQAYNTLWVPGTDHAGIATQAVVERLIFQQEKKTRHDLGREALVKRIWQWKEHYEQRILTQLKQLGCSCDWRRTRFTLDEGCSRAVRQTFFDFFKKGLIFRGKRLVNWDTHLQTAVADDEIFHEAVKGSFWTFKYPVKEPHPPTPLSGSERGAGGERLEFIRFSTTRPETMLGDTAVAVHPDDPRYKHLIGKMVTIPLVNRDIPIIADGQLVDPALGTGAVKVTPAHDSNDYACYQRHPEIGAINILTADGTINKEGGKYAGLDRYEARKRVTADMEALGLLESVEDRDFDLAHSDRSKTPIEPYLSDQWFVKMGDGEPGASAPGGSPGLAQMAMDAVTTGRVKFHPERYAKTYLDWLGEKRDWCISRQLWWGHRIPIWYAKCAEAELRKTFGNRPDVTWRVDDQNDQWLVCALTDIPELETRNSELETVRDPDVLDTWFSSALWPFATLGWPEETPELNYYYPTNVLVTSRGIITLWVARMVLAGLFEMKEVPFHDVYITPTILDGFGETMSKSKGNGVDPLDIIARYGTDALRYHMVYVATETQDSRMPVANVCPHCDTLIPVKQEHMSMRTRRVTCPSCKQPFRPGGPWVSDDPELKTARQASEVFEQGRNFANKLWNAARFVLLNLDGYTPGALPPPAPPCRGGEKTNSSPPYEGGVGGVALPTEDRWILSRLAATATAVTEQLEAFRFSEAARTLYDFTWSEFCDWYVEMAKSRLRSDGATGRAGDGAKSRATAQRMLVGVLDGILRLLHPIMPFVTESIWQALNEAAFERGLPSPGPAAESVMIAAWPSFPAEWRSSAVEARIGRMQELVRQIRNIRNQFNVNERASVDVSVRCPAALASDLQQFAPFIVPLAKVGRFECGPSMARPPQSATAIHADFEAYVHLKGLIDVPAEIKRMEKQRCDKEKQLQGVRAKLSNASFVARAPAEVVQQQKQQETDLVQQIKAIDENLQQLRQG